MEKDRFAALGKELLKLALIAFVLAFVFSFLSGCGLSSKLYQVKLGDSGVEVERKMGAPQMRIVLSDGELWLWCAADGPGSSQMAFAKMINERIESLESETIIHHGNCRQFLKAVACKIQALESGSLECTWLDQERI